MPGERGGSCRGLSSCGTMPRAPMDAGCSTRFGRVYQSHLCEGKLDASTTARVEHTAWVCSNLHHLDDGCLCNLEAPMTFIPSYSFYNDFDNCPHKAWRKYIKRDLPYEEKSEAQHRGTRMHVAMENAIGKDMLLPDEWKSAQTLVNLIKNFSDIYHVRVEYKLAMTMDGPCAYDAQAAWFRGKLDFAVFDRDANGEAW